MAVVAGYLKKKQKTTTYIRYSVSVSQVIWAQHVNKSKDPVQKIPVKDVVFV